jgi:hypothetical protein
VHPEPPLLIIAPIASDIDLTRFPWCPAARHKVCVNRAKFRNLEMMEVLVDAMPFLLTRLTAAETSERLAAGTCDLLSCDLPGSGEGAIAIAPSDTLASDRHVPEVHRRLLMLGQWIGESLDATTAAWMPARKLTRFAWFDNVVRQYLAGRGFPSLFHISFLEGRPGEIATRGLRYFTGQEIHLTLPPDYRRADADERLADIIADIIAHGRITLLSRSKDSVRSETLTYTPSANLEQVEIRIRRDAKSRIAAER